MAFAKLFDGPRCGQLLIKCDTDQDGAPEVRVYFQPPNLGVCSVALSFPDTDDGAAQARTAFDRMDMPRAEDIAWNVLPEDVRSKVWTLPAPNSSPI